MKSEYFKIILDSIYNIGCLCGTQPIKILLRNFGGMLISAHFPANLPKFQIFVEQSIFVVQKRLVYEKAIIFNEKYDEIKIKRFA